MFRMLGKKVELYRYKIIWLEDRQERRENCISDEHKKKVEQRLIKKEVQFTTEVIDQTNNEWFNGLEFESYDKALEVFNKGEQVYLQEKAIQGLADNLKLRADIDYLAIISGVEI